MKTKLLAEALGSLFLTLIVLGSGAMAQELFPGEEGLALLANAIASAAGLFVLIECLMPLSGAHFNPALTLTLWALGKIERKEALSYISVQLTASLLGVFLMHGMFALPLFELSQIERSGSHLLLAEIIATFGLIMTANLSGPKAPQAVACYILSAYWFTSSTGFANPALTLARGFTNTFGGMSLSQYPSFVLAQLLGATLAVLVLRKLRV